MKSPAQLCEARLLSAAEHKKRATAIKRIAGGIRTEIASAKHYDLSPKDLKTLQDAVLVLGGLARIHEESGKLRQFQDNAIQKAIKTTEVAMKQNFGQLTSIADRVSFIAAVRSWFLQTDRVQTINDLEYYFDECFSSLAWNLGKQSLEKNQLPATVVNEAWQTFLNAKQDLLGKYKTYIVHLEGAAKP